LQGIKEPPSRPGESLGESPDPEVVLPSWNTTRRWKNNGKTMDKNHDHVEKTWKNQGKLKTTMNAGVPNWKP